MIAAAGKPAQDKSMIILGIETSCDETGVAVYDTARSGAEGLRAQALYSQVALHAQAATAERADLVGHGRRGERLVELARRLQVDVGDHHVGAEPRQAQRVAAAQAARRAGDDGPLACQGFFAHAGSPATCSAARRPVTQALTRPPT